MLQSIMGHGETIHPAMSDGDVKAAKALFEAYARTLPVDLSYQNFQDEVNALPGLYAPPRGALLLMRGDDGAALGCAGLRPSSPPGRCEMKRLFLQPEARGLGLGERLAQAVIQEARRLGYRELVLDTLESMTAALRLYQRLGFERIAPYYGPTPAGTAFLRLRLSKVVCAI